MCVQRAGLALAAAIAYAVAGPVLALWLLREAGVL